MSTFQVIKQLAKVAKRVVSSPVENPAQLIARITEGTNTEFPKLAQQVRNAKVIGEMSVKFGRTKIEKIISERTQPAATRAETVDAQVHKETEINNSEQTFVAVDLPVEDYQLLTAKQVIAKIVEADAPTRDAIRTFELRNRQRKTILDALDRLQER